MAVRTALATQFQHTKAQTTSATNIVECTSGTVPCVLPLGTLVTIFGTITVHGAEITNLPTGTITFYANGTPLGPPGHFPARRKLDDQPIACWRRQHYGTIQRRCELPRVYLAS